MSKFICENQECVKYGLEDEYLSNRYKVVDGELQSNNAPCPKCGKIRKEISQNSSIPLSEKNIDIAKYGSSSTDEKKEILKKRSQDHYKREIEPFKNHQLHEAVKGFKEASRN